MSDNYSVKVTFTDLKDVINKNTSSDAAEASIKAYNWSVVDDIKEALYKEYGVAYATLNHNAYGLIISICERIAKDSGLLKGLTND